MMGMNGGSSGPQTKNSAKRQKVSDMNPFSGLETRLVKMEKILDTLSTNNAGYRLGVIYSYFCNHRKLTNLKTKLSQYANIRIGPVVKKDVMKASTMLEHNAQ